MDRSTGSSHAYFAPSGRACAPARWCCGPSDLPPPPPGRRRPGPRRARDGVRACSRCPSRARPAVSARIMLRTSGSSKTTTKSVQASAATSSARSASGMIGRPAPLYARVEAIRVHRHHQHVRERLRALQVAQVADVQQVEDAVGERHRAALRAPALAACRRHLERDGAACPACSSRRSAAPRRARPRDTVAVPGFCTTSAPATFASRAASSGSAQPRARA